MAYDFKSLTKQADEASNRDKFYTDFENVDPNVLHQISDLTEWIRTKGKGSDVREVIAQLFERTWLEGAKEGNANLEVAKARSDYPALNQRLDAMSESLSDKASITWIENQLNSILSSTPKASLANLAEIQSTYPNGSNGIVVARDSGKWYYWSESSRTWAEGGTYQSRTLGGNEVTADNIDFVQGIQQMLIQKVDGAAWTWNGKINPYSSADWARYMPINLLKGKTYYIFNARGYFSHIVSADGTRQIKQLSTTDTIVTIEYTATEDSLLYISTNISNDNKVPKVFNASVSELKAAQVDFANLPDGYVTVSIPKLSLDVKAEDLGFVNLVKQLLDDATMTNGVYYTGNKTATSNSATWGVYPPVYLTAGKTYGLKNVRGFFSYYFNNNDQLVKKFATSDILVSEDFTPSENGYLLITRRLVDESSKLILGGLSKSNLLPNLDYGSSAFESDIPFVNARAKTDFTVKKDGSGDFTNLVAAVNAVGDGTVDKPINIYVHSGTYDILAELGGDSWLQTVESTNSERLGIVVPDYVNIIGVGDAKLHLEVPDDKTTANTAKRISLLNVWKHNTIKNLKMYVKNTRYVVHDETNNSYHNNDVRYIDCYMEHKGNKPGVWASTQAYAAGTGSNGNYLFENCTFKSASIPFSMHDNANQDGNTIKIRKCTFVSGDTETAIRFGSHGQNTKMSYVTIENCNIDKAVKQFEEVSGSGVGNHFRISGGGNTVVPYININSAGRKERIEFADEVRVLTNSSQQQITIGQPVKLVGNTIQPLGPNEPWLFYGLSLDEIVPGQSGIVKYAGYVAKLDTGISTLSQGQRIGLVNGNLSTVDAGDFIGYAVDANNILLK
ncbi:hypothetical protein [Streptococcus suis]|uniref:hypothetical protein n=1 Tax=Streptococcus suis TaxID=1307 RepID=UPI000CF56C0C|nr:hypothetical protein [Streptococcus suis]